MQGLKLIDIIKRALDITNVIDVDYILAVHDFFI